MNRTDRAVIAALVLVLAVAVIAIGGPALGPGRPAASTGPSARPPDPYREGAIGRPTSVNPLGARSQVDRDLVALVFQGLVKLDPNGNPEPDLAVSWAADPTGASWTFTLRPGVLWQDGEPVTADDVVFTVNTLRDPDYHGPGAGSWNGVNAVAVDDHTVRFDLDDPFAGFLELATQPIAPRHLLADTPPGAMATDPFGEHPIGSGLYAVVELDRQHAVLEAAASVGAPAVDATSSSGPTADPLATTRPTPRPSVAAPSLARIEFRFFDDAAALTAAYRAGELDAASGLSPADAAALTTQPGTRLVRDPTTTVAVVAFNLRPAHLEFRDPRVRLALLEALDRPAIVASSFGGMATLAASLIPPTSWAFDATASPTIGQSAKAAAASLKDAGWTKAADGWRAPDSKTATELELLVPDRAVNPVLFDVGTRVAADWTAIGMLVRVVEVDPAVLAADHLRTGAYSAAIVEIEVGHDPDLYPLLASSQTQTGGANVLGLQDPVLDDLLVAARKPAADDVRKAAFIALQGRLAGGTYAVPIAWPEAVVAVRDRVIGPSVRAIADGSERFWDVLSWRLADDR